MPPLMGAGAFIMAELLRVKHSNIMAIAILPALLSTITPPVCGTVFIAAGMAETPWIPVAGHAMKLGFGLYLIPLAFVANPGLLQTMTHPLIATLAFLKIGLGLWLLSQGIIGGKFPKWIQAPFVLIGLFIIFAYGIGRW